MPRFHLIALLLLALGYTLALSHGNLGITTLPTFLALLASALLARRPQRWQQALGHTLFILLAIALALHWLPGFNAAKVHRRRCPQPWRPAFHDVPEPGQTG
ncbi:CAAX amino terminal protease [Pseudomonas putida S11]|nr:CAAX amino terminal protease [Pseudomonas putida S11]